MTFCKCLNKGWRTSNSTQKNTNFSVIVNDETKHSRAKVALANISRKNKESYDEMRKKRKVVCVRENGACFVHIPILYCVPNGKSRWIWIQWSMTVLKMFAWANIINNFVKRARKHWHSVACSLVMWKRFGSFSFGSILFLLQMEHYTQPSVRNNTSILFSFFSSFFCVVFHNSLLFSRRISFFSTPVVIEIFVLLFFRLSLALYLMSFSLCFVFIIAPGAFTFTSIIIFLLLFCIFRALVYMRFLNFFRFPLCLVALCKMKCKEKNSQVLEHWLLLRLREHWTLTIE